MALHAKGGKMRFIYKRISILAPHCEICGCRLEGNGSEMTPYSCPCGKWEWDKNIVGKTEYKLIPEAKKI